jgi:hypothetical protein
MQETGRFLIIFGLLAAAIGAVLYMGWAPQAFGWLGRLPGDIRVERDNFRFYFPIATSVVLSVLLTVIIRLFMMFRGSR